MASSEEQLSPEEKLLKVIQGKGDDEGDSQDTAAGVKAEQSATVKEPESADGPEEAVEPAAVAEKAEPAAEEETTEADTVAPPAEAEPEGEGQDKEAVEPAALIGTAPPAVQGKRGSRQMGIRTVNKCLAAVVVILILFAVLEIWANIQSAPEVAPALPGEAPPLDLETPGSETDLPDIKKVLQQWTENPIVGIRDEAGPAPTPGPSPAPAKPVATYAEEHLNLIGLSVFTEAGAAQREAIVVDGEAEKMLFLKKGDTFSTGDWELEVLDIQSDSVKLTDGKEELIVK